jgi:DNA-binding PucR family transcriptional regulator
VAAPRRSPAGSRSRAAQRAPLSTLAAVLGELDDEIATVVPMPDPTAVISRVIVWEPATADRLLPGALVLGINLTGGARTAEVLGSAGRARCAGVLIRKPDRAEEIAELADAARAAGVALLLLDAATPWSEVLQLAADTMQRRAVDATDDDVPLGDLFALADAIADMVGGPVTLEDPDFRVLAYSRFVGHMDGGRATAILGRRMPPEWAEHLERIGALDRLRTSSEVVDVTGGPGNANRRLIVAVRDGSGRHLGVIWVAEAAGPLPDGAPGELERAMPIAVPHYQRHLELLSAQSRHRQQLVRALLDGHPHQQRYADELELPRAERTVVLAFTATSDDDLPKRTWERILDYVALSCEARRWVAPVTRIGRAVLVIATLPRGSHDDAVTRLGRDIVSRSAAATGEQLRGAASSLGTGVRSIARRRAEAERALTICRVRGSAPFVHYDDVRAQVIVDEVTAVLRDRTDLRIPGLEQLRAEDAKRKGGGRLVATLAAYLDTGGAIPATAALLSVHPTTVRYRLERIGAFTSLALDDPTTRLACALLLRADESAP